MFVYVKFKSGDKPDRTSKDDFSAAALFGGNSGGAKSNPHNITCTFREQNHASSKCKIITDVNLRKAILKSKGKCFDCLRSGHKASKCKSTNKCYKCRFWHHLSICDFHFIREKKTDEDKQNPNHTTMLAFNKEDGVLLQTATSVVFSRENSNKKKNVRILSDKGSQNSLINQSLRNELNLKTQKSENKILEPFGEKNEKMRKLDIVNVYIADTKIQNIEQTSN